MKSIKALCAVAALLAATPAVAAIRPNVQDVEEWINRRSQTHPAFAQKVDEVRKAYQMVFVPGVLGSRLKIGNFTYGEHEIKSQSLLFAKNQGVEASTLNFFKAHVLLFEKKVDIYGTGLDQLAQAFGGSAALEFAYDWRDDIEANTDRLQTFLRENAPNKRIVLVAHSMGGVIAWNWKRKYPPVNNPVTLAGMVLLGSPLQGSCEPARMLIEGYGPPVGKGTFEKWATHLVFGKAQPAIFTFPSVFQLMPRYDKANPCVKVKNGPNELAQDHHEPGTWLGRPGGQQSLMKKFLGDTGLKEDDYLKRVEEAVAAGRRFRQGFSLDHGDVHTYLLVSRAMKLQRYYLAESSHNWLRLLPRPADVDGDGRVPATSASNDKYFDYRYGGIWPLHREHGDLLSDTGIPNFIDSILQNFIIRLQHVELIAFGLTIDELRKDIEAYDWEIDPTVRSRVIKTVPAVQRAQEQIAVFNTSRATGVSGDLAALALAAKQKGRELEPDNVLNSPRGSAADSALLYKAALVLDPDSVDARTLNRLGLIQIKQHRYREAYAVLKQADSIARTGKDLYLTDHVRKKITVNLNFASQQAGLRTAPTESDHSRD